MCAAPQSIEMMAKTVNMAAVTLAANCPRPASAAAEISDAAAMPSARVEPPMSTVRPPHTMKSTPTRFTCDSGAKRRWEPFDERSTR